jgi:hypothetical protein
MRLVLLADIVIFVFYLFVLVFAASAEPTTVRNLPKWAWILILVLFPVIGGIAYLVFGRPLSAGPGSSDSFRFRGQAPKRGTGPIAPDDDPDFLRELDRKLKNQNKDSGDAKPGEAKQDETDEESGDKQ